MKTTFPTLLSICTAVLLSACSSNTPPAQSNSSSTSATAPQSESTKNIKNTKGAACQSIESNKNSKGKNDAYLCSASIALNSAEAKEVLDPNIRVSYGNVGSNTLVSRQIANAVGKTPDETCQRAFLNTVKRFQSTAQRKNSNAIRVISYFDKKTVGNDKYECHIGTWNSRVVLKGNI